MSTVELPQTLSSLTMYTLVKMYTLTSREKNKGRGKLLSSREREKGRRGHQRISLMTSTNLNVKVGFYPLGLFGPEFIPPM